MNTGEKIRKIRFLKGLSQEYLASKLGISQNSLSKIELGETKVSEERLNQLSKILELSPEEIINFDDKHYFQNNNSLQYDSKLNNSHLDHEELISAYKEQIKLLKEQCSVFKELLRRNNIIK